MGMKSLRGRNSKEIFNRKNGLMKITFLGFRKRWGNKSKNGLKGFQSLWIKIQWLFWGSMTCKSTTQTTKLLFIFYFVVVAGRRSLSLSVGGRIGGKKDDRWGLCSLFTTTTATVRWRRRRRWLHRLHLLPTGRRHDYNDSDLSRY